MDVGAPSNFERMMALYGNNIDALRKDLWGAAFSDAQVVAAIGDVYRRTKYVLDPHSAIGWLALEQALAESGSEMRGVFLATAHPAKFRETVEPAIGKTVPLPNALAEAVARPRQRNILAASYEALASLLRA